MCQGSPLDFAAAREFFEKAVRIEPENPFIHAALAQTWSWLCDEGKARAQATIARKHANDLGPEKRLWIESVFYVTYNDLQGATKAYQALCNLDPKNLDYCIGLAEVQTDSGRGKDALGTLRGLRSRLGHTEDDPRIDLAEALAWESLSDFAQAVQAAAGAAAKAESQGKRSVVAEARREEGSARLGLRDYQGAKRAYRDANEIVKSLGDSYGEALAVQGLAEVFEQENDVSVARTWYDRSLDLYRRIGCQSSVADVLDSIASMMAEGGQLAVGIQKYEEALKVWRLIGDKTSEAETLIHFGGSLQQHGDLIAATQKYEGARATYRRIGDRSGEADALDSSAGLLIQEGDLRGARTKIDSLRVIRRSLDEKVGDAEARVQLAEISLEEGRAADAEKLALEAIGVLQEHTAVDSEAEAQELLARCLLAEGKLSEAQNAIDRARTLFKRTGTSHFRLILGITAARISAAMAQPAEAAKSLADIRARADKTGFFDVQLEARLALAEVQIRSGDRSAALAQLGMLERDARAKGFGLIAKKAATIKRQNSGGAKALPGAAHPDRSIQRGPQPGR
jgi:tetratricopeptide (TPR) repeat protein